MRLIIEIDMGNAAFNSDAGDGWEPEVRRILGGVATAHELGELQGIGDTWSLIDVNGNKVGTAELRRSRTRRAKR